MSETVKLIIEIPDYEYKQIKEVFEKSDVVSSAYSYIYHGTPLDDVKAEIKAMFPPSGNWMYDEECEHEHTVCEVLADVLRILDNIGKGDKE